MSEYSTHPASYRDPSGFVFLHKGVYYRQVNRACAEDYDLLIQSGLYRKLTEKGLLISHTEMNEELIHAPEHYKTLLPQQIARISYPCEWSPDQLKDAGLLTLKILGIAIGHGMILKDATPLNIQFQDGKPVFIDTLSFTKYDASLPWVAYRQFCECFLFPLYLHHYLHTGIGIMRAYPEGIPAALTAKLLPWKSRLNTGVWLHVLLQSRIGGDRFRGQEGDSGRPSFNEGKLRNLIRHLEHILTGLASRGAPRSAWSHYYDETILSKAYLDAKEKLLLEFTEGISFISVLDLGANNGHFSRLLAQKKAAIIAVDSDWQSIAHLYRLVREQSIPNILPLCVDISDPTPATGFRNAERASFTDRMNADLVVALALVHHLVLRKNIPFEGVARYFAELTRMRLIIEFVPLSDEKALELIRNKSRWYMPYDQDQFERCFGEYFLIERKEGIAGTARILYRMKKKDSHL